MNTPTEDIHSESEIRFVRLMNSLQVCRVCGDRAIGYNFDALTCESCRSFFRRNCSRVEFNNINWYLILQLYTKGTDDYVVMNLKINRCKELFSSVAVIKDPTVRAVAYEVKCVSDAIQLLHNRTNQKFLRMDEENRCYNGYSQEFCTSLYHQLYLMGIVLFNPHQSNLVHKQSVILQQQTYMYLLQRYLEIKHNSKSESETHFRSSNFGIITCESCRSFFRRNENRVERTNSMNFDETNKTNAIIPSLIRGLIFNFNELEINRFKELFNSVAVVRNPSVRSIAYETVNVREALELLLNGADVMFSRMVKMSLKISGFNDLCEDDKIVLLKAACPQLTILQSIIIFNFNGEFWTIPIIFVDKRRREGNSNTNECYNGLE
ncbi:unnamed protein product [Medioppia subpectinata]|uniref:Nuclear receptor domain-containing protein n=1 Tax=Medioppia subpectinata TaxID=1979941 RepID=A0A7R9PU89_9ACAR|nr:unnamed protein product [Medioppia subpectinata]CAG2100949.1 unnamed protein product [Medioppia subpectinata]